MKPLIPHLPIDGEPEQLVAIREVISDFLGQVEGFNAPVEFSEEEGGESQQARGGFSGEVAPEDFFVDTTNFLVELFEGSATGVHGLRYEYGPWESGEWYTKETKLEEDGDPTGEWTTTVADALDRHT